MIKHSRAGSRRMIGGEMYRKPHHCECVLVPLVHVIDGGQVKHLWEARHSRLDSLSGRARGGGDGDREGGHQGSQEMNVSRHPPPVIVSQI